MDDSGQISWKSPYALRTGQEFPSRRWLGASLQGKETFPDTLG
jgi:hypothetical protein